VPYDEFEDNSRDGIITHLLELIVTDYAPRISSRVTPNTLRIIEDKLHAVAERPILRRHEPKRSLEPGHGRVFASEPMSESSKRGPTSIGLVEVSIRNGGKIHWLTIGGSTANEPIDTLLDLFSRSFFFRAPSPHLHDPMRIVEIKTGFFFE
jgi:hypothetical protein